MNFSGLMVLARIEEDNTQRAYFRVRPLMTEKGNVPEEEIREYQDEGFLRVVPDKNEQHTFKERMRSLGEICVINLTNMKPDFSKIRPNKNYNPQKGEHNRFIVYSDAVQAVPDGYFYDVVSSDEASKAVTPSVFIRNGAFISGPLNKDNLEPAGEQIQVQPDSVYLHTLQMQDESERLICWPVRNVSSNAVENDVHEEETQPEKPQSAPENCKEQEADTDSHAMTVSEDPVSSDKKAENEEKAKDAIDVIRNLDSDTAPSTNLLKEQKEEKIRFVPALQRDQRLTGTPLYQSGLRQNAFVRSRNPLSETVEKQRYGAGRYESTGAEITDPAKLKKIDNPLEAFGNALDNAWSMPETRERIADAVLNNQSLKQMISQKLGNTENDLKTSAVKEQLQDMEAERLMQLMRLEDLRKEREKLFEEAISEHAEQARKRINEKEEQLRTLEEQIAEMTKAASRLQSERDEMLKQLDNPEGNRIHLYRVEGETVSFDMLAERVYQAMNRAGFEFGKNDAITVLLLKLICGSFTMKSHNYEDAVFGAQTLLNALGAVSVNTDEHYALITAGGNSFMASYGSESCMNGTDHVYTSEEADESLLPVFEIRQNPECIPEEAEASQPVNEAAIYREVMKNEKKIPDSAIQWIKEVRKSTGSSLCLTDMIHMNRFIKISQNYLSGGLPAALDIAVQTFVIPLMKKGECNTELLKSLLTGLTGSLRMLEN